MFHAVDLLAGASVPRWRPSSDDPVAETAKQLRGRVRRVPQPAVPPLRLPRDPKFAAPLLDELARIGDDVDTLAAVAHVVTEGALVLPGPLTATGSRQYALADVVDQEEDEPKLVILRVNTIMKKRAMIVVGASIDSAHADESCVRATLGALYLETESPEVAIRSRGRNQAPTAYWAGAPRNRAQLPGGWERQLAAAAALDGYILALEAEPGADVRRTARALQAARPELVLFWRPWLPSVAVEQTLRQAAASANVAEVDAPEFEDALAEASMYFEAATVAPQLRVREAPKTVAEALAAAKGRTSRLVYLPSADLSASASPYVRPHAILDALLQLDEIAAEYADGRLPGGFEPAFASRGLSYSGNISQTARQQYRGSYEVPYEGETVMLGPHLRFGRGSPRTCARIYWYVDTVRRELVIGHVGRHLPDATSGI